jgi:hypothetical protein
MESSKTEESAEKENVTATKTVEEGVCRNGEEACQRGDRNRVALAVAFVENLLFLILIVQSFHNE